jgi:DNA repair protein RecO (recombination protein O)
MDERSHGVVLRVRPLTETSLVVHWLTPDLGRLATVAKGARRPRSPFLGKLDLLVSADFSYLRSRRSDLHTLREVAVTGRHPRITSDLHALHVVSYAIGLVELVAESDTPIPEIHELFLDLLHYLESPPPTARAVVAFELKLLACQGLEPDPTETRLPAAARELLRELMDVDWTDLASLQADAASVRALRLFLHGYLIHHLGKLPRGRSEALQLPGNIPQTPASQP